MKKYINFFIVVAMVFCLLPMKTVMAEETTDAPEQYELGNVSFTQEDLMIKYPKYPGVESYDRVYVRKNGYPNPCIEIYKKDADGNPKEFLGSFYLNLSDDVLATTGLKEVNQQIYIENAYYDFIVNVEVVDVVGEIIKDDDPREREYYVKYDDYKSGKFQFTAQAKVGDEIIEIPLVDDGEFNSSSFTTDREGYGYLEINGMYKYHPKYKDPINDLVNSIDIHARVFLFNEKGDLVDEYNNVIKKKEDFGYAVLCDQNYKIYANYKKFSLPSNLQLISTDLYIDNLDTTYYAFELKLEGTEKEYDFSAIDKISMRLPYNLKGQDIKVYALDEQNNRTPIDYMSSAMLEFNNAGTNRYLIECTDYKKPILESFTIKEFNGQFKTGDIYEFDYSLRKGDEISDLFISLVYTYESRDEIREETIYLKMEDQAFVLDQSIKYLSDHFSFKKINVSYNDGKDTQNESYYLDGQINDSINNNVRPYKWDKDYSFTLEDYVLDNEGPEISNIVLTQNKNVIHIEFDAEDSLSGFSGISFSLANGNPFQKVAGGPSGDFDSITIWPTLKKNGNHYSADYAVNLSEHDYGDFKLLSAMATDAVNNTTFIYDNLPDFIFTAKKEDNVFETITEKDLHVSTLYGDGKIYLRKDSGVGNTWYSFSVDDQNESWLLSLDVNYLDKSKIDLSKSGTYKVPVTANYHKTKNEIGTINTFVEVEVVDVVGTILPGNAVKEIMMNQDEFEVRLEQFSYLTAQLNDGQYVKTKASLYLGGLNVGEGINGNLLYVDQSGDYLYNPKYKLAENENDEGMIKLTTHIYIIDENGNLVDKSGKVTKLREKRNKKNLNANITEVQLSALEYTVPSYTKADINEVKVNNIEGDYVAYDINLIADYVAIQPKGTVDVTIDLPTELNDKEVEVYYVDDNGVKHLVEGSKVENGKVTFDTDHFSTYAVIAKDNKPEEPEKPTEPEKPVEPEKPSQGNTEVDVPTVNPKEEVKEVTVGVENAKKTEDILNESIKDDKVLGPLAEKAIQEGKDVNISAKPTLIDPTKVSAEVKKEIEKIIAETSKNDLTVAQYLDITIHVMADNEPLGNLTSTKEKLKFQIAIPEDLKKEGRTFIVFRIHDGKVEKLETVEKDGLLVFESDQFSTYALAYKDTETTKPSAPNTSDHLMILNFVVMTILSGLIFVVLKKRTSFEK